jgi:hypothetical protein
VAKKVSRVLILAYIYVSLNLIILMLGLVLFLIKGQLASGLGIGLIASGITGLLLSLYYMSDLIFSEKATQSADAAERLGLMMVLDRRPHWRIREEPTFMTAREIDILEVSCYTLTFPNLKEDWDACRARRIRVLILDPLFPDPAMSFAGFRDAVEHRPGSNEILIEVRDFIRKFGSGTEGGRFEVRLSRTMPTLSYFRFDSRIYWAPLLHGLNGDATPHLLISDSGIMHGILSRSFEELWEESVPPPANLTAGLTKP